ncbi:MAG: hypothetical protein ACI9ZF_003054 [Bradyrhizobium sp.]
MPRCRIGQRDARQDAAVRAIATRGIEQFAGFLDTKIPAGHQIDTFGLMSCMVGALVMARAVDNPDLATSIRESARHFIRSALYPETTRHD